MKRAVLCVSDPWNYIDQVNNYSIMIVDPNGTPQRRQYLLDNSDWSLLITDQGTETRDGKDYNNEKVLWYTSGTTGNSKFYSFSQAQLDRKAQLICEAHHITDQDHYVAMMPLWHGHGQSMYWAARWAQCKITHIPVTKLRTVAELEPTFISATPAIINAVSRQKFNKLKFIRTSSQKLPDALYWKLKNEFEVPVIETYGLTEALGPVMTNLLHEKSYPGTVGKPWGFDAKIVDGELHIRGFCMFTDQWYATGDLADLDANGNYQIRGRKDDAINVNGFKINPQWVEDQLYNLLPGIEEIVLFGKDRVHCVYVGNYSEAQVKDALIKFDAHCNPKLLKKLDAIPKTSSNKVSRLQLLRLFTK